MKEIGRPEIVSVDRTADAVIVYFKDEDAPAVYPAGFLHAAIGIAAILYEREFEERNELKGFHSEVRAGSA